jgi:hypothetical protein
MGEASNSGTTQNLNTEPVVMVAAELLAPSGTTFD